MNRVKLSSLLDIRRGQSLSGDYYSESGQLKRLTLGNFDYPGGGFKENTAKKDIYFIGDVRPEFILSEGDIITPLTEQVAGLLGETATIPCSNVYIQSGDIGLVVPNETKADKRFLAHLISSPMVKKQLAAGAQQTKIRHTSPEAIKDCTVWIPETIAEQNRISTLLDFIDSEIKLNSSICADLEATAKLLYDYWFVQFDFPDENGKPYKSSGGKMVWSEELKREIPEGWSAGCLENLMHITMGQSPSGDSYNAENRGTVFFQGRAEFGDYYPRKNLCTTSPKRFANADDVLLSVRAPVGDINFAFEDCCIGRGLASIRDRYGCPLYAWFTAKSLSVYFKRAGSNGTTFGAIDKGGLAALPVVIPTVEVRDAFAALVNPIYEELREAESETLELGETRDFLLPLLMNGQVTIRDGGK